MTTNEIIDYYAGLLIKQYAGSSKAQATIKAWVTGVVMPQTTVESATFAGTPASGAFTFTYNGIATASIAWNDSQSTIQTKLRAVSGLSAISVSGSIAAGLIVTFTGVTAPAKILLVGTNSLLDGSSKAVTITIAESDLTLPLAIQDAFNLNGSSTAVGNPLDVLGKYAGVTRTGTTLSGAYVTLNDSDFLQLIRMAIVTNNAGSDLATVENFLQQFFPSQIFVYDYQNMRLAYIMNSSIGSENLIQLMLTEGLLPKPMGVQLSVAVAPDVTKLFAFRTYQFTMGNGKPFNRYTSWNLTWQWLSYADIL